MLLRAPLLSAEHPGAVARRRACKVFYLLMKISGVFLITSAGRESERWRFLHVLRARHLIFSSLVLCLDGVKRKLDGKNFCLAVTRERERSEFISLQPPPCNIYVKSVRCTPLRLPGDERAHNSLFLFLQIMKKL